MSNTNKWIKILLDNLEKADNEKGIKALEDCGRDCCRSSGYYKKAVESMSKSKDVDEFVERLMKAWSHLHKEDGNLYVVYEKCYCPLGRALMKDYPGKLSAFCNCSRGWVMEMFESALKRPVKVELQKSVVRGDGLCRFKVTL
jgi:hypothetical protein